MAKLKDQYKIFADAILAGENQKQAAIDAGYSEKSAHVQADRMLNNDKVIEYIESKREKTSKKLEITRESQLERLSQLHDLALTPSGEYGNIEIRNAIAAIQEQNKMLGFLAPTKTENKTQMELKDLKPDFGDR